MSSPLPNSNSNSSAGAPSSLMDALDQRASVLGDAVVYRFLRDGVTETETITFGELRRRALRVAHHLTSLNAPGERAVLLYQQGIPFLVAFFGCLYAGVIAVPAAPPTRKRGLDMVRRIATDCGARWLLATGDMLDECLEDATGDSTLARLSYLDTECLHGAGAPPWVPPSINPGDVALLQYTAGSTRVPRAIAVTHANLVHNHQQVALSLGSDANTVYVSWLPLFHDMGLGIAVQAVWVGVTCVLMSPQSFVQDPLRWLTAIARYRGTSSGGPDFAFEHCVRRIAPENAAQLDLSCWRVAYNGGEPVKASTLKAFASAFAISGFRGQSFHPVYGLAEATLLVSSQPPSKPPHIGHFSAEALEQGRGQGSVGGAAATRTRALVSCGGPWLGAITTIVDPLTMETCGAGQVGEIWVKSPSVAAGYWDRQAETVATFYAFTSGGDGPYLRTGDLGFIEDGHLYVTGRERDLMMIGDHRYYPQDIEATASGCDPALAANGAAAFVSPADYQGGGDTGGGRALVVIHEVARTAVRTFDGDKLVEAIRRAVAHDHGLEVAAVVLVKPATLLRTTSGKIRHGDCRQAFLKGGLQTLHTWTAGPPPTAPPQPVREDEPSNATASADLLIQWLRRHAADLISCHQRGAPGTVSLPLLKDLAKQGILGIQVPPAHGGLGLGHLNTTRVLEQLAAVDFLVALFVGINNYLGIEPIARHGSAPTKAWLLPALAHGEEFAAFAFAEPGSATPASAFAVRAPADGEERWRLFGTKYLDGVSDVAGVVNVFVAHKDSPGVTAFVTLQKEAPPRRRIHDGFSGALLGWNRDTLAVDGMTVGRDNLLGAAGGGLEIAREAMTHARLALAAACIGGMKRCAQLVGRAIQSGNILDGKRTPNPVLLSRLGSVKARVTALECLVRRSALAMDRGQVVPAEAFVACKVLGPELLLRSIDDLLQLGVTLSPDDANRIYNMHRDAGLLQNFDGGVDSLAELTGALVMEGGASLRTLIEQVFGAPQVLGRLNQVVDAIQHRSTKLNSTLAPRAQRWAYTRAGELANWVALLAATEASRAETPTPKLQHAYGWAKAQLDQALSSVYHGTPSEAATVDSLDVAATFAAYARTIGDIGG